MKTTLAIASALLAMAVCGRAGALEPDQFRCFRSIDQPHAIRLEFVVSDGPQHASYAIYEHGKGRIQLDFMGQKTLAGGQGRPDEIESRWREAGPDADGEYVMVSQGAIVSGFRYVRKRDGKMFHFEEDTRAAGAHGCTWLK